MRGRRRAAIAALAAAGLALGCGGRGDDPCARALARLERVGAARGWAPTPARTYAQLLDACRHDPRAASDPSLACAMRADSDAAAGACLDAFLRDVIGDPAPRDGGAPGAGAGQGLNPLLAP